MQTHAVTNYTRSPVTKRPRFYRPTENGGVQMERAEKEKKIEMQQKKSLIQNRISLKKTKQKG